MSALDEWLDEAEARVCGETRASRFVEQTMRRQTLLTLSKRDVLPGEPWSMAIQNESEYLAALAELDRERLRDLDVEPYWAFLHVGGCQ